MSEVQRFTDAAARGFPFFGQSILCGIPPLEDWIGGEGKQLNYQHVVIIIRFAWFYGTRFRNVCTHSHTYKLLNLCFYASANVGSGMGLESWPGWLKKGQSGLVLAISMTIPLIWRNISGNSAAIVKRIVP